MNALNDPDGDAPEAAEVKPNQWAPASTLPGGRGGRGERGGDGGRPCEMTLTRLDSPRRANLAAAAPAPLTQRPV